jgi:hypothetical protein
MENRHDKNDENVWITKNNISPFFMFPVVFCKREANKLISVIIHILEFTSLAVE